MKVAPKNLDAATIMYLQSDTPLTGSDLFIPDVYHLLSVEPSLYIISLYPDTHRVPLSLF